jgi:Papain family cysteine protease
MDTAFEFVLKNGGIDTEEDYRYHAVEGVCSINREHRHVVTIDDYDDGARDKLACLSLDRIRRPSALCYEFASNSRISLLAWQIAGSQTVRLVAT